MIYGIVSITRARVGGGSHCGADSGGCRPLHSPSVTRRTTPRASLAEACPTHCPLPGSLRNSWSSAGLHGYAGCLVQDPLHARLAAFLKLEQSDPVLLALVDLNAPLDDPRYEALRQVARQSSNDAAPVSENPDLLHQTAWHVPSLGRHCRACPAGMLISGPISTLVEAVGTRAESA